MLRQILIPALILALPTMTGACVAVYPAVGARAQPGAASAVTAARAEAPGEPADPAADRWPARWGAPDAPRGLIVPIEHRVIDLIPRHLGRFHHLRTAELEYRHAEALAKGVGIEDGFRFEAEGPGSLVFLPPVEAADAKDPAQPGDEAEVFAFVSAQETADSTADDPRIAIERTWFALYDADTRDVKGTIVLIPGMLGTPQPIIEGQIRAWRTNGYAVLRFLAHPSRFTERAEVQVTEGDEADVGRRLAEIYDQRTAECAFAADAALDHVFARRPSLRDKPVVLVGMSGGAMVLPTVYAYAPERYDAAVLIAGGANFLKISVQSNYAEWIDAIVLDWEPDRADSVGEPTPDRLERVSNAYLSASRLDATHTAPELADIPVLMLHATRDRAVPSATGDTLWRLLNTPERWVFNVGHEVIFVMLPMQTGRVLAWIDRAAGLLPEEPVAPPAPTPADPPGPTTGDASEPTGREP